MKSLNIVVAGLGNVGSALINSIQNNSNIIYSKSLIKINILGVSAKNRNKKRACDITKYQWHDNPLDLIKLKTLMLWLN